jgi:pyruvate/2-oxoglutarate dehydrogenase complex dihydrolipoamide dehydrogenase (E3) component
MVTAKAITPDLCVVGAGSAGLSVAAGAAQMGAKVVLIEKGKMGGDCLNTGCVPSKALLAAAHCAASARAGAALGVMAAPTVDFGAVHHHVHDVIVGIAPYDSVERFEKLGVTVIQSAARFTSEKTLVAAGYEIRPRRFVIATGSHAFVPPIDGLSDVPYFTNETIFDLTDLPRHLIILGGGPMGCELAQAFRGLGAAVTLIEMASLLPKDDRQLVTVVRDRLRKDGITLLEGVAANSVAAAPEGIEVTIGSGARSERLAGTHLLVAVGRRPTVDGLHLDRAGIGFGAQGIAVDRGLRTTNKRAYAIGDCIGGFQFTHMASYHASIVVRSALFRLPSKTDHRTVIWVTYTDPALAQVGLTEAAARSVYGDKVRVLISEFADNDRARAERKTDGLIKVVTTASGHILGAGIAGAHAGELIQPWVLAMANRLKIGALATMIAPYPTFGEINKRAAGAFYTPTLFGARTRALVKFLSRFG